MIETFAALLFAHVLADFVLQPDWIVREKRRPGPLLLHMAIVLVTAQAALGQPAAWELLVLAAVHGATDALKARALAPSAGAFLIDQALHLAAIAALAALRPDLWAGGLWAPLPWLPAAMTVIAGAVLTVRAGGFAVGLLMAPLSQAAPNAGLPKGGALIGILERGIIFLLVLVGQPAGIGFLIAAKSVLRFDATSKDQGAAEYVIVGTLASFGWAIAVSYATVALMAALPPLGIPVPTP